MNQITRRSDILTKREREVLRLIMMRFSVSEIAKKLGVSINTVKFHKKHIYEKLDVKGKKYPRVNPLWDMPFALKADRAAADSGAP